MTGDPRVSQAREYLDAIAAHSAELPPSVLVRESAELRRLLRLVLGAVDDLEAAEIDEDVTQLLNDGGIYFIAADTRTVMDALTDAAWWRAQHGTAAGADRYRELMSRIGDQR